MINDSGYRRWIVEQINATDAKLRFLQEAKAKDLNILFGTIAVTCLSIGTQNPILSGMLGVMCFVSAIKYIHSFMSFNIEIENYKAYCVNLEFEDMDD